MGLVVSFYSYKGGVGRTQLAANLAAYLCYHKGRKVLLVEWDLEAPGLHYYFKKENDFVTGTGLIEMLDEYVKMMRSGENKPENLPKIDKKNIVSLLNTAPKPYMDRMGKIDLFPAGKYDESFAKRVNDFKWEEFKTLLDGNVYIAMLREQLKALDYDYVFIDSRTGVSDYSGYCTILLPDMNVFVIAPNNQNYKGSQKIAQSVIDHPYIKAGNRKSYILPVLSRLDENAANAQTKINEYNTHFNFLLNTWGKTIEPDFLPLLFEKYNNRTVLKYNANIAVGENLLFSANKETQIGQENFEHIANSFLEKVYEGKNVDFEENIDEETWFEWAYEFAVKKNYEQAILSNKKLLEINPNHYIAWSNLGFVYNQTEQYEKSIESCKKSLEINLAYNLAWNNLAYAYYRTKEYDKAIECNLKSLEIKPDDQRILRIVGWAYFIQGKFLEAEKYFVQATTNNFALANLGHIRLYQQKEEEALALYRQSLAMYENKEVFFELVQNHFQYLQPYGVSEAQFQAILAALRTSP